MLLHILWMILKIILLILGVVLGLIILAILLVLFCPVVYRADVKKETEIKNICAHACISWLFQGILVELRYENQNFTSRIRILGIPLDWLRKKRKSLFRKKKRKPLSESSERKTLAHSVPKEKVPHTEPISVKKEKIKEKETVEVQKEKSKTVTENKWLNIFRNIKTNIIVKLKKFRTVLRKLQFLYNKAVWWKEFWDDPKIKTAVSVMKQEIVKILKHIFPTRIQGKATFGFEDPSITGMILAILGITIPLHKNCIEIEPLYSGENVFVGSLALKGRIYGIFFLIAAIKLYFNKNIKYAVSRWKHKEG